MISTLTLVVQTNKQKQNTWNQCWYSLLLTLVPQSKVKINKTPLPHCFIGSMKSDSSTVAHLPAAV
jgi:hypothetical protein